MRILGLVTLLTSVITSVSFAATKTDSTEGTRLKYTYKPAQQETNVVFMPTLGMTFNQISGGEMPTSSFATGFNAGFTADVGQNDTVFHTGLLYSQMNSTFDLYATTGDIGDETPITQSVTVTFVQNSLMAPVQGKTYFGGGNSQAYVKYGALVNFLLDAKAKALGQSQDIKEGFNTMNILASVGAGVILPFGADELTIDASFNRSISSVSRGDEGGSVFNSSFMINAGIAL